MPTMSTRLQQAFQAMNPQDKKAIAQAYGEAAFWLEKLEGLLCEQLVIADKQNEKPLKRELDIIENTLAAFCDSDLPEIL